MQVSKRFLCAVLVSVAVFATVTAKAQTLATGDTRTVTEPIFPAVCSTVYSQMAIVSGGPASETAYDTTRIQTALTACPSGKAVELAPSGTNYAFLIAPINIPSGVGLIVDGGVTVFASRNPADYQTTSTELCGGYGASGNGCTTLIKLNNNGTSSNNGIYGYGIIDGRGGSTLLKNGVDSRISWWTNADQAHTAGMSQDNPIILKSSHANNFTLYKITFRNSPVFHVGWGGAGFTAWGVKISSPFTAHNTDGIDPSGSNVTIINASISNGDDNIAVGAGSTSANITISNINTYSGHGISVGSYTSSGLNNMLVQNVNMAGTASDSNATGLRLKSAADRGGLLNTITYKNICLRDTHYPIMLDPFYNTNSGTLLPQFQNIVYQNVHVLAPTGTKYPYLLQLQGYDANHISTVTFNNVVFDQLLLANVKPAPQDITIALAGNVYPAFLQTLTGTGVSYTGSATSTATGGVSTCANVFPYIVGELYLSTASATNLQTATISTGGSVTLNAMVEPAMSQTSFSGTVGSWTGVSAPSASINFYEGATLVGSAALGANGTLAPLTLSNVSAGTHTYTAQYPGDSNYSSLAFGSVTVTVTGPTIATTTTLTAPATVVYGSAVTLSTTVTGTGGTPGGSITFYDGTSSLGSATLSSGAASLSVTLAGGSHSLTAVYSGDTTFLASTSTASTLTITTAGTTTAVTANPSTVSTGSATLLTATVTGLTGSPSPTGTVTFKDGATTLGSGTVNTSTGVATYTATLTTTGAHTITASYGGDGNYAASNGTVSVQVNTNSSTTTLSAPATTAYGSSTTLSATVSGTGGTPSGTVTFYDGATSLGVKSLTSGTASLSVTLTGGTHALTAVYSGDTTFGSSTSSASSITVSIASSTTTVTANPTAVSMNGATLLAATVVGINGAGVPTGTVSFSDGTTILGSGTVNSSTGIATYTATLSTPGTRSITASYSGNINYAVSTATTAVQVTSSSTTVLTAPATAAYGASATLSVTVTGTGGVPTGNVTFYEGATSLGVKALASGIASLSITPAGGVHTLTAVYSGDTTYLTSTSAISTLTVTTAATTTAVTASPATVSLNGTILLTATVSHTSGAAALTGTVAFTDGTTNLGNSSVNASGVASLPTTMATIGARTITATYSGDGNYAGSSATAAVQVNIATTTTLTAPATVAYGTGVTLSATVSATGSTPTGTLSFYDGATMLGTVQPLTGGVASISGIILAAGTHSLTAVYAGTATYLTSTSAPSSLIVTPIPTSITLGLSATATYPGSAVTLTATITPVVAGQTVTFLNGTATLGTAQTNASGVAILPVTAGALNTTYLLTANLAAANNYGASSSAAQTLTVIAPVTISASPNPITIAPGSSGTVAVTLTPAGGFTGTVTLTCTPAVSYITCSTPSTTVNLIGLTPGTPTETINVATTTASLSHDSRLSSVLAMFLPFSLLGLFFGSRTQRAQRAIFMSVMAIGVMVGINGCGSGGNVSSASTTPSGSQTVTLVATASGTSQTATITVNIH